jgi:glycosyltransferase involved in cell wall biosynthesis
MDQTPHCLSVVIPCFNEAATIEEVMASVLASPYTAEVIVVDDGSTDGTLELARRAGDSRVRVLAQPFNQGKGAALRRGFCEARADFVIVQDADLEYDPRDYEQVLEPLLQGRADVVFGSRFQSDRPHRVLYYWHFVANKALTTASNMLTNLNLTDMETCYKAFRREVIQSITIEEDRFGFEPEITAKVAQGGWRVYEVGISYAGRTYGEGKKISWKDGFRALYCIFRYSSMGRLVLVRGGRRRPEVDQVVGTEAGPRGAGRQPVDQEGGLGLGEHLVAGLEADVDDEVADVALRQPRLGRG